MFALGTSGHLWALLSSTLGNSKLRRSEVFRAGYEIKRRVPRKDENQMYVSRLVPSRDFLRVANAPMALTRLSRTAQHLRVG